MTLSINMEDEEKVPKWAYLCPYYALYYGTQAILKAMRKRRAKLRLSQITQ